MVNYRPIVKDLDAAFREMWQKLHARKTLESRQRHWRRKWICKRPNKHFLKSSEKSTN
jgi:hypothetical protein